MATGKTDRHMETGAWDPLRRHFLGVPEPDQVQSLPRSPPGLLHTALASSHLILPQEAQLGLGCLLGIVLGKGPQGDGAGPGERRLRLSKASSTQAVSAAAGQGWQMISTPEMLRPSQVPCPPLAHANLLLPSQRQVSGVAQPRVHSQDTARTGHPVPHEGGDSLPLKTGL